MAKRTIKPSKQKTEEGQPETPETITIPEQPVEVKAEPQPDAADLLDMPSQAAEQTVEVETIPATLVEPETEKPDETVGVQLDPNQPSEWMAKYKWEQDLEDAKNDHLEACLQLREAQQLVKAAREREKDALDFYRELYARGPVIPKPVTPPEEQSGTQQPLPGAGNSGQGGADENGWRLIPLTNLPLDSIQGLGEKKRDALLDACPTLGHFTDKQVEAGASGVNTVLPKGIGKAITDPLEEMVLNAVCKWRNENGKAADEAAAEPVTTETATATTPASETASSSVPSFTEWELMTTEQQSDYANARAAQISESVSILNVTLSADFRAGGIAYGRGERVIDCPRIPGDEMDSWLAGYFDAASVDAQQSKELDSAYVSEAMAEGEPEAVAASSGPAFSLMDLDDI